MTRNINICDSKTATKVKHIETVSCHDKIEHSNKTQGNSTPSARYVPDKNFKKHQAYYNLDA